MKTRHLQLVTHTHSVTIRRTSNVLSPFGPVSQGLTTTPRTDKDLVLSELLRFLERKIDELNTKSFTVLDTLTTATKAMRAEPYTITTEEDGIK